MCRAFLTLRLVMLNKAKFVSLVLDIAQFAEAPQMNQFTLRLCLETSPGFERLVFRLAASGCIDDRTNIACFAVFARRKNARSRA